MITCDFEMEEEQNQRKLSNKQISDLAEAIPLSKMTKIAENYLTLKPGVMENTRRGDRHMDSEGQSREIFKKMGEQKPQHPSEGRFITELNIRKCSR